MENAGFAGGGHAKRKGHASVAPPSKSNQRVEDAGVNTNTNTKYTCDTGQSVRLDAWPVASVAIAVLAARESMARGASAAGRVHARTCAFCLNIAEDNKRTNKLSVIILCVLGQIMLRTFVVLLFILPKHVSVSKSL